MGLGTFLLHIDSRQDKCKFLSSMAISPKLYMYIFFLGGGRGREYK